MLALINTKQAKVTAHRTTVLVISKQCLLTLDIIFVRTDKWDQVYFNVSEDGWGAGARTDGNKKHRGRVEQAASRRLHRGEDRVSESGSWGILPAQQVRQGGASLHQLPAAPRRHVGRHFPPIRWSWSEIITFSNWAMRNCRCKVIEMINNFKYLGVVVLGTNLNWKSYTSILHKNSLLGGWYFRQTKNITKSCH